jgi:hypothetical protein
MWVEWSERGRGVIKPCRTKVKEKFSKEGGELYSAKQKAQIVWRRKKGYFNDLKISQQFLKEAKKLMIEVEKVAAPCPGSDDQKRATPSTKKPNLEVTIWLEDEDEQLTPADEARLLF